MNIKSITFTGMPSNYSVINKTVSRSAQPLKNDFAWLKSQGVTDVINFRTMHVKAVDFDEQEVVEKLGMKYHNIPSITMYPKEESVRTFLDIMEGIEKSGGKAHIHCKAGADRTGMYAYIYKSIKDIGNKLENQIEMIAMGHNQKLYPDLLPWTDSLINKLKNIK